MVEDYQLAVTVVDDASGRVQRAFQESVALGAYFIWVVSKLKPDKTINIDADYQDNEACNHIFASFQFIIFSH